MAIEFYDVRKRQRVSVDERSVRKVVYHPRGTGSPRYALRAEHEGSKLTKFVSKADWDKLNVPLEQAA